MAKSKLQKHPRSKILKRGYINIYSHLTSQERRQIYYKTLYKKNNPDWDDGMVYLSQYLGKILKSDSRFLDIGCGNGNYLVDENRRKISWAVGIDMNERSTEKNICLDQIVYGNIEKLPFPDKSFNIVVSLWTLEHLKNPDRVLREIHRVLRKGGVFIFISPNYNFVLLKLLSLVKFPRVNYLINRILFGRRENDIFKTYYKVNTIATINRQIENLFDTEVLKTNYDPGYTSFNKITFGLSNNLEKFLRIFGLAEIWHPHIIGVLRKKAHFLRNNIALVNSLPGPTL